MSPRFPVVIAASTFAGLGLIGLGDAGGVEALLGPSLAAVTATIFVLIGR